MDKIRVRSDFGALLRSRATRTFVLLLVLLTPLTWLLYRAFVDANNEAMRVLYGIGVIAPALGIVVTVLSFLVFLIRRRRVVLVVGKYVKIPRTRIKFPLQELAALQLYAAHGRDYLALIPIEISERLDPASAASGQHGLHDYIVEFPLAPNTPTFEIADRILQEKPATTVHKIGAV
ncbi:hypothetical protein WG915_10090 [Corynebacterium sp. H128]|uniref:hypothetical protein n=1 Tax=Corynebacterium sp. H128 TaxID=3133427 RepID=UPI0030B440C0